MITLFVRALSCSLPAPRGQNANSRNVLVAAVVALALLLAPFAYQPAQAFNTDTAAETTASLAGCQGVYHVVRAGQTLYSIAGAYGTTAYRVARCNGLASYTVYVGQTLLIPRYR